MLSSSARRYFHIYFKPHEHQSISANNSPRKRGRAPSWASAIPGRGAGRAPFRESHLGLAIAATSALCLSHSAEHAYAATITTRSTSLKAEGAGIALPPNYLALSLSIYQDNTSPRRGYNGHAQEHTRQARNRRLRMSNAPEAHVWAEQCRILGIRADTTALHNKS